MKTHGKAVCLDTDLRNVWFGQGRFGVSRALFVSAKWKHHG